MVLIDHGDRRIVKLPRRRRRRAVDPEGDAQSTKSRSTLSCRRLRSSLMPSCMTTARRITSASPALLAEQEQVPGRHHRDEGGQGEELAPQMPEAQRFGEYRG